MARAPKPAPTEGGRTLLTLEQFSAIEAWTEAMFRFALKKPTDLHAPLVTAIYQKRQRAMQLLTGVIPPETDDVDAAFARLQLSAAQPAPAKKTKPPASKPDVDDDYSDIA